MIISLPQRRKVRKAFKPLVGRKLSEINRIFNRNRFTMTENELSRIIIGSAIKVHSALEPGLLENAYQECLYYELRKDGFDVQKEKSLPLMYEGVQLDCGYRVDLLVENKIVLELKSVSALADIHTAQLITYLRLGNYRLGLLINFNEPLLKYGIKRIVNQL